MTFAAVFCLLVIAFQGVRALKFVVAPGEKECIDHTIGHDYIQFQPDDLLVEGTIRIVNGHGQLNRDFRHFVTGTLTGPDSQQRWASNRVWSETTFSAKSPQNEGTYVLCFENAAADAPVTVDLASFVITHSTPNRPAIQPPKVTAGGEGLANHMHLTELHDSIVRVKGQLDRIHGEQIYYGTRIKRHMQTNEEVYWRALLYPGLEIAVTASVAAIQVFVIHRLFSRRGGKRGLMAGV